MEQEKQEKQRNGTERGKARKRPDFTGHWELPRLASTVCRTLGTMHIPTCVSMSRRKGGEQTENRRRASSVEHVALWFAVEMSRLPCRAPHAENQSSPFSTNEALSEQERHAFSHGKSFDNVYYGYLGRLLATTALWGSDLYLSFDPIVGVNSGAKRGVLGIPARAGSKAVIRPPPEAVPPENKFGLPSTVCNSVSMSMLSKRPLMSNASLLISGLGLQ